MVLASNEITAAATKGQGFRDLQEDTAEEINEIADVTTQSLKLRKES